jgi:hypothetical protein
MSEDVPLDAFTSIAASSASVKNTSSTVFCGPYPSWIILRIPASPEVKSLRRMRSV